HATVEGRREIAVPDPVELRVVQGQRAVRCERVGMGGDGGLLGHGGILGKSGRGNGHGDGQRGGERVFHLCFLLEPDPEDYTPVRDRRPMTNGTRGRPACCAAPAGGSLRNPRVPGGSGFSRELFPGCPPMLRCSNHAPAASSTSHSRTAASPGSVSMPSAQASRNGCPRSEEHTSELQ